MPFASIKRAAIRQCYDCRNSADPKGLDNLGNCICTDIGKDPLVIRLTRHGLKILDNVLRIWRARRTNSDNDRDLHRPLEDVIFKISLGNIDGHLRCTTRRAVTRNAGTARCIIPSR